jgi:four helix bundle protein
MASFQRLDVDLCAIEFMAHCEPLLDRLPPGHAALSDQLRRAAMSIPLDIAHAQGRTGDADKARTYAIRVDHRQGAT